MPQERRDTTATLLAAHQRKLSKELSRDKELGRELGTRDKETEDDAAAPRQGSATLPAGWEEVEEPSGKVYYYNATTGESRWEQPEEEEEEEEAPKAEEDPEPEAVALHSVWLGVVLEAQQRAGRIESHAAQINELVLAPVAEHIKELDSWRSALQKTGSAGIKALHELHKTLRSTQVEYLKDKESAEDAAARLAKLENTPNHKSKELKRLEERSAAAASKQAAHTVRCMCTHRTHTHCTCTAYAPHSHIMCGLEASGDPPRPRMAGGDRVQAQLPRGAVHRATVEALRGGAAPGGGHHAQAGGQARLLPAGRDRVATAPHLESPHRGRRVDQCARCPHRVHRH